MVNVWEYVNARKLKITVWNDAVFIGRLVAVMDSEENGEDEDDITIECGGQCIGFLQSEIKEIEIMD